MTKKTFYTWTTKDDPGTDVWQALADDLGLAELNLPTSKAKAKIKSRLDSLIRKELDRVMFWKIELIATPVKP